MAVLSFWPEVNITPLIDIFSVEPIDNLLQWKCFYNLNTVAKSIVNGVLFATLYTVIIGYHNEKVAFLQLQFGDQFKLKFFGLGFFYIEV